MKEDYLDDLYGWITSQDETYSNTYDLEGFKAKMQDTEYSSRMYDWINSIDDTFKDSHTLESFQDRVKKKTHLNLLWKRKLRNPLPQKRRNLLAYRMF